MDSDRKNKEAVEIYDVIAEDYARNFDTIDSEDDLIFPNTFLSHVKPQGHIIDIGCGTGFSAGYFSQRGMTVEGSDLSKNMIAIAQRNYPDIPFTVADMRTFEPEQQADAVWAGYSVFHFDQSDFERTLEQIKRYLKPKGVLGVVVQEGTGEIETYSAFFKEKPLYVHLYTGSQLEYILNTHGFSVIERKTKQPMYANELEYNKLLYVAELD